MTAVSASRRGEGGIMVPPYPAVVHVCHLFSFHAHFPRCFSFSCVRSTSFCASRGMSRASVWPRTAASHCEVHYLGRFVQLNPSAFPPDPAQDGSLTRQPTVRAVPYVCSGGLSAPIPRAFPQIPVARTRGKSDAQRKSGANSVHRQRRYRAQAVKPPLQSRSRSGRSFV